MPSFAIRIADAPTFDEASDLYMEARGKLDLSSAAWGKCVLALTLRDEIPAVEIEPLVWSQSATEWFGKEV